MEKLKKELLELLKTDEEFRYAVLGLLGIDQIIKSIEDNTKAIKALQRQAARHSKETRELQREVAALHKTVEEHTRAIKSLQETIERHSRAIESLQETIERHSKAIQSLQESVERHSKAIEALQAAVERHSKAIVSLQEAVERHSKVLEDHSNAIRSLQEAVEGHSRAIRSLQEAVDRHSRVLEDHSKAIRDLAVRINALGTRWGVVAEDAFRESVKYLVEDLLKEYRAERWTYLDEEGYVFGKPSMVEADLLVRDDVHILVEFKASADRGDVYELYKIGQLYEKATGIKPKLLLVAPYVRRRAVELARELGVEIRGTSEEP